MITFEIVILGSRLQEQEKRPCMVQRRLWERAFLFQDLGHSEGSIISSVCYLSCPQGVHESICSSRQVVARPPSILHILPPGLKWSRKDTHNERQQIFFAIRNFHLVRKVSTCLLVVVLQVWFSFKQMKSFFLQQEVSVIIIKSVSSLPCRQGRDNFKLKLTK